MTTPPVLPFHPLADLFPLIDGAEFDEIARAVISRGDVAGVGDSLFDRELSQTWRYGETKGDEHVC